MAGQLTISTDKELHVRKLTVGHTEVIRVGAGMEPSASTWSSIGEVIGQTENLYPGIDIWLRRKVQPGTKDGSRICYLIRVNGEPTAISILKKGTDAKICSLRVADSAEGSGLGTLLMMLLAHELGRDTRRVHFTIPSSIWCERGRFFESFGFKRVGEASRHYRTWDEEVACSVPALTFQRICDSLKHTGDGCDGRRRVRNLVPDYVMSIRPAYADRILSGAKTVELRRRFSSRLVGSTIAIYASGPSCRIVATAVVAGVERGKKEDIWQRHEVAVGCSQEEFDSYCSGAREVNAVMLHHVTPIEGGIAKSDIESYLGTRLTSPMSYYRSSIASGWSLPFIASGLLTQSD